MGDFPDGRIVQGRSSGSIRYFVAVLKVRLFDIGLAKEAYQPITKPFKFMLNEPSKSKILNVRGFDSKLYLCSPDFVDKIEIESSKDFPFEAVANNPKVYFWCKGKVWKMKIRSKSLQGQTL